MARLSVLFMLVFATGITSAADLMLRSSVTPEKAWVGQRVILNIDVLSDRGWAQIEKIDELDVSGAYVMRTDSQGTRLQETIKGTSYTGQRYALSIYPQIAGLIQVPAIPVAVKIKAWGENASSSSRRATVPAVSIKSELPKGADNIRGLISTTQYTAQQSWEPELTAPKVGDAIKRIITIEAADVSGMAFTPLDHGRIRGVGIYPSEPGVNDSANRGSLTGTRKEAITYVFEATGEVTLPDIDLHWWDIDQAQLKKVSLPGMTFKVVVGDQALTTSGIKSGGLDMSASRYWQLAAVVLSIVLILVLPGRWLLQRWLSKRREKAESEETYFKAAIKSVRSKKASLALRKTMRWLDRINRAGEPAQLDAFVQKYGDDSARQAVQSLMQTALRNERLTEPDQLVTALIAARENWLARQASRQQHKVAAIPELNY